MESAPALKSCPCCYNAKTAENYSPDIRNKDGLNYKCKACHAAHFRAEYSLNPIPARNAVRKYRESLHDYQA